MSVNTQGDENVSPDLHPIVHKFKELPENDQLELIEEASRDVQEVKKMKKLPEESETDYRVRKFTELFNNLPLDFLVSLWSKARDKLIRHPVVSTEETDASEIVYIPESRDPMAPMITRDASGEVSLHPQLFKVKTPDLKHGGLGEEEGEKKM